MLCAAIATRSPSYQQQRQCTSLMDSILMHALHPDRDDSQEEIKEAKLRFLRDTSGRTVCQVLDH